MSTNNIKVVCRFRPPNSLEIREGGDQVVTLDPDGATVTLGEEETEGSGANTFTFDRIFGSSSTQREVFDFSINSTVDDVLKGYNGTVFAYGQTGSGKTFTMMGSNVEDPTLKGIIPRIVESIFKAILVSPDTMEYTVNVSYMEIYMERIRDLLNPRNDNLPIHEDKNRGVYVKGLMEIYVNSVEEVYEVMRQGGASRAVAHTNMNAESSRSHSIFVVTINQKNLLDGGSLKSGKLYLVDLAGSEKVGKTGASGQTLEEAKKINKSLSSLGMVINALTDGKSSHVPYRDSKLTRILQESLGGNSRTTLIINCSPAAYNLSETLSTLRFGMRAKKIRNKAKINQDLSPAELKALLKKAKAQALTFQQYIQLLEKELNVWRSGGSVAKENQTPSDRTSATTAATTLSLQRNLSPSMEHLAPPTNVGTPASVGSMGSLMSPNMPSNETSRPWTPSALADDEREEFLARENNLMDSLAEKENEILGLQKELEALKLANEGGSLMQENKTLLAEVTLANSQRDKLKYENEDLNINYDTLAEHAKDLQANLNDALSRIIQLEKNVGSPAEKRKERIKDRRVEKIARMMTQSEAAVAIDNREKEIRDILQNLERMEGAEILTPEQTALLKSEHLELRIQVQNLTRELTELKEDKEVLVNDCSAMSKKAKSIESDYEGLLANAIYTELDNQTILVELQTRLEAQFNRKCKEHADSVASLQKRIDSKSAQVDELTKQYQTILRDNEKLKVSLSRAERASQEVGSSNRIQQLTEDMAVKLEELEQLKTSLAADLEERCGRVAELEITLEETEKEYQASLHQNHKYAVQKRKLDMLESHLEQLVGLHKDLVDQNHSLKKEVAASERKLNTRNDRIVSLEKLLDDAQSKIQTQADRFERQLKAIKERNEQRSRINRTNSNPPELYQAMAMSPPPLPPVQYSRVAKPMRGGSRG